MRSIGSEVPVTARGDRDNRSADFRRLSMGVSGSLLLLTGIGLAIWPAAGDASGFWQGTAVRTGLVLLAAWLAWPQLDRLPNWVLLTIVVTLLILAARPRLFLALLRYGVVILPLLLALWWLSPRRHSARRLRR
jgi:hypothetical protein